MISAGSHAVFPLSLSAPKPGQIIAQCCSPGELCFTNLLWLGTEKNSYSYSSSIHSKLFYSSFLPWNVSASPVVLTLTELSTKKFLML